MPTLPIVPRPKLLATLALALLVSGLAPGSKTVEAEVVEECPIHPGASITFYSDDSFNEIVGEYTNDCGGNCLGWGRISRYELAIYFLCAPPDTGQES